MKLGSIVGKYFEVEGVETGVCNVLMALQYFL